MHIIFGQDQANIIRQNHTVLELDTFRFMPKDVIQTAYTVLENIPIEDLPKLSFQKDLHHNLIATIPNVMKFRIKNTQTFPRVLPIT